MSFSRKVSVLLTLFSCVAMILACGNGDDAKKKRPARQPAVSDQSPQPTGQTTTESSTTTTTTPPPANTPVNSGKIVWKALLMTGDNSITAFDNARKKIKSQMMERGIVSTNIKELSMMASEQNADVMASSEENLRTALMANKPGAGEGCLIHMTSHGSKTGFVLKGKPTLTPDKLNQLLDESCGTQPTVLLVSACYSGVFINATTSKPNRIILTAARKDRTSFGCSSENEYTYWDSCLISLFPTATSWTELHDKMDKCIEEKESGQNFDRSFPQAFFGADTTALGMPSP